MVSALDVARYLIRLGASGDEPDYLSQLRVQKLLYYTQGWALATLGRPLFCESIQAWNYGPVVDTVWRQLKKYDSRGIQPNEAGAPEGVSNADKSFIKSVWEQYKVHSAIGLMKMTHDEAPWKDARVGLKPGTRGNKEITHKAMLAFFSPLVKKLIIKDISVADAHKAATRLHQGKLLSHAGFFSALRNR
jgi:uncharacterized phage-associated protein